VAKETAARFEEAYKALEFFEHAKWDLEHECRVGMDDIGEGQKFSR